MPAETVEQYLAEIEEPKRSTLEAVRKSIHYAQPGLTEAIAWGVPVFKLNGKNVAGICAAKNHLIFAPQSPTVMELLAADLAGFKAAKASFQFAIDTPLDAALVAKLVAARVAELG